MEGIKKQNKDAWDEDLWVIVCLTQILPMKVPLMEIGTSGLHILYMHLLIVLAGVFVFLYFSLVKWISM